MGSGISLPVSTLWPFYAGRKGDHIVTPSPCDTMSDEEAIALIESRASLQGLGPIGPFGRRAKVWHVAPDTVLKRLWEPVEPYMMELASSKTSIPIPKFRAIELPNKDIPGPIQPSGEPLRCRGHYFSERGAGPFQSYSAMTAWYNGRSCLTNILRNPRIQDLSMIPEPTTFFDDSMPLVFTHGDISPYNVRLGKDGTVWLLDWQAAGAYPQWFEYANMMAYDVDDPEWGWPRGFRWFIPFIAGWYRKQLSFLVKNSLGIDHYGFDGFD
ncbi:hypothetical protein M413DRAFT_449561 [Hebeloma cylindrosporum]|uniref:Aminoglycoside phosphotransferase domain-containing protein n=1 Tax=Hebeloma cylindrosporum TaxID=76867 RepID=A0A0C3BGG3_HEBCY|nr:hypothetical protein M413DRAFT_449561 [Hebeloma cylindrosporum h7]